MNRETSVEASCPIALSVGKARAALISVLANTDLSQAHADRYAEGVTGVHGVGPRGVSKRVLVRSMPATQVDGMMVVPIRWEATGAGGRLFPTLNANIAILPVNEVTSLLLISGRYDVPLGRMGEILDRTALAGIAQRTLDLFVRDVARRMGA